VVAGPDSETAAARRGDRGHLRASNADREQVIAILKAAFMQGRLTEDELGERAGQAYAARTYAELAEVTADIPAGHAPARPRRDPWRATKIAWGVEFALILPGVFSLLALKGPDTTTATVIIVPTVISLVFWTLGVLVLLAARSAKRAGGAGDDTTGR
jgi:hypothetical protein